LKHAYLAAYMKFGELPGEAADEIRRDLIAARDAKNRNAVPYSRFAQGLTVLRSYMASRASAPPVMHAAASLGDGEIEGVVLGGSIFVSWSSDLAASNEGAEAPAFRVRLEIAGKIGGEVTSVG
jgi:hypothetical protein